MTVTAQRGQNTQHLLLEDANYPGYLNRVCLAIDQRKSRTRSLQVGHSTFLLNLQHKVDALSLAHEQKASEERLRVVNRQLGVSDNIRMLVAIFYVYALLRSRAAPLLCSRALYAGLSSRRGTYVTDLWEWSVLAQKC